MLTKGVDYFDAFCFATLIIIYSYNKKIKFRNFFKINLKTFTEYIDFIKIRC